MPFSLSKYLRKEKRLINKFLNKDPLYYFKLQLKFWFIFFISTVVIINYLEKTNKEQIPAVFWPVFLMNNAWWLWVMFTVNSLIKEKVNQKDILQDITSEIKILKEDIKKNK